MTDVRIVWSDHLVALVGQSEAAAARLEVAPAAAKQAQAAQARRDSARLSVRLDASPLTDDVARDVDEREEAGLPLAAGAVPVPGPAAASAPDPTGGWARALRLDGMATDELAAIEYANLLTAADLEPQLAPAFLEQPLDVLAQLQAAITRGLVVPQAQGRLRRTDQAIHDGAEGKIVYRAPDPEALPRLMGELVDWVTRHSGGLPPLVVAGVVQERLLEWQPFEAGNGRVARAASRVVLRALDLDPFAVAVPERYLMADRVGYHAEIAATRRRRGDLTLWLERYGEALASALTHAADAVLPLPPPQPPPRAGEVLDALGSDTVSVKEYAALAGVSPATARLHLRMLAAAGIVRLDPRTRGLQYRRSRSEPVTSLVS